MYNSITIDPCNHAALDPNCRVLWPQVLNFLNWRLRNLNSSIIFIISDQAARVAMSLNSLDPWKCPIQSLFLIFPWIPRAMIVVEAWARANGAISRSALRNSEPGCAKTFLLHRLKPQLSPSKCIWCTIQTPKRGDGSTHSRKQALLAPSQRVRIPHDFLQMISIRAIELPWRNGIQTLRECSSHCRFGLLLTQQPELVKPWWRGGIEVLVSGWRWLMLRGNRRLGNVFTWARNLNELLYIGIY